MTPGSPVDLAALQAAIGRRKEGRERLDETNLARFALALGAEPDAPPPAMAHWAFFHDVVPDVGLGDDGHPRRGDFLPALPELPRRMYASGQITFAKPLRLGVEAAMISAISDARQKHGGTGDLVFVEVTRTILQDDEPVTIERQTLVFMPPAAADTVLPISAADGPVTGVESWTPRSVNLFRFSAATFNNHRIHYDRDYAVAVERYPALVVHGPFVAARLAEFAARRGALASFEFRASAPNFVDQPIRLGEVAPGELVAIRCDGVISMQAKATYR